MHRVGHAAISSAKSYASQRGDVKGNKRYEESYNEGIKVLQERNGMNLAKKVWSLNSALAEGKAAEEAHPGSGTGGTEPAKALSQCSGNRIIL